MMILLILLNLGLFKSREEQNCAEVYYAVQHFFGREVQHNRHLRVDRKASSVPFGIVLISRQSRHLKSLLNPSPTFQASIWGGGGGILSWLMDPTLWIESYGWLRKSIEGRLHKKWSVLHIYEMAKKFTLNVKPFFIWSMVELNSKAWGTQYMFTSHGDRWGWIFIFHTKLWRMDEGVPWRMGGPASFKKSGKKLNLWDCFVLISSHLHDGWGL